MITAIFSFKTKINVALPWWDPKAYAGGSKTLFFLLSHLYHNTVPGFGKNNGRLLLTTRRVHG